VLSNKVPTYLADDIRLASESSTLLAPSGSLRAENALSLVFTVVLVTAALRDLFYYCALQQTLLLTYLLTYLPTYLLTYLRLCSLCTYVGDVRIPVIRFADDQAAIRYHKRITSYYGWTAEYIREVQCKN